MGLLKQNDMKTIPLEGVSENINENNKIEQSYKKLTSSSNGKEFFGNKEKKINKVWELFENNFKNSLTLNLVVFNLETLLNYLIDIRICEDSNCFSLLQGM